MAELPLDTNAFLRDSQDSGNDGSNFAIQGAMGVRVTQDALKITGIDDDQFVKVAAKWVKDSKDFYHDKYHLEDRRAEMEKYRFTRQQVDNKLENYNSRLSDGIIYESEEYLTPIVFSSMPDIIIKPGNDTPQSQKVAEDLSTLATNDVASRERKRVMTQAFQHEPVYFLGVIKTFWNPQLGSDGDYDFKTVHPENIVVDHTSPTAEMQDMRFVAEYVEYTVKEWVMRFPNKKQQFFDKLRADGVFNSKIDETNESGMNSVVKGMELWFKWYIAVEGTEDQFEEIHGVAWLYKDLLLDKIKDPNWDWKGKRRAFSYKSQVKLDQLKKAIATGQEIPGLNTKQVFYNFLAQPEFPYYFMTYNRWGKQPLSETSRIEQQRSIQEAYDKSGRTIQEKQATRTKHIFSTASGLSEEDLQQYDANNPKQHFMVDGPVSDGHAEIRPEEINPSEIQFHGYLKDRGFEISGVNQPIRGQVSPEAPATSMQLGREGDFTRADNLSDETVTACAEWMARWIMQHIKLRYTKDHMVRMLGIDGKPVFLRVNQDMIEDGQEVGVNASGVDKLKAKQNAFDLKKLNSIDPLNMFKDLELSDPEGRANDLMMFLASPQQYQLWLQSSRDPLVMANAMGTALNGAAGQQQAQQDIAQIQQGNIPQVPNSIDNTYIPTIMQFLDDPQTINQVNQFEQANPGFKDALKQWLQQVSQLAAQAPQGSQGGAQPQPQAQPNVTAGPTANQNPSPQNPSQTPAVPVGQPVGRSSAV